MLRRSIRRIVSAVRLAWLRRCGATIGTHVQVDGGVQVCRGIRDQSRGSILVGNRSELGRGCVLSAWGGQIQIGENVFVGPYVVIYGHGGVTIGDGTLIAMQCCIVSSNHSIPERGVKIRSQPDVLLRTTIGADVWLGANVTVLGGVNIGDGCIVGAGSVVTSDLPPGAIAFGVPARPRKFREGYPAKPLDGSSAV